MVSVKDAKRVTFPTTTEPNGVVVVRPEGRLNMILSPSLRQQLHNLVEGGNTRLVVDLAAVEAIDSSGLGELISGLKAARQAGGDLRIIAPSTQALTVLELTKLSGILPTYESADDAFPR
jgi:anti-sigma B factor antagonist